MDLLDLTLIWFGLIGLGLLTYVILDGFGLGVGILFPFAPSEQCRDDMMDSTAPVWGGNQTWVVFGGAGLLAAFPLIYSVLLPALYIGVFLLLAALIFRGLAFEFRAKATTNKYLWDYSFFGGSIVAAFAQGAVIGAYVQGFETENMRFVGGAFDWLSPFTVMTGLGVVAGYALLGLTWTIMKTEGRTQEWAYKLTPWLLGTVMVFFVLVSLWTPLANERVMYRWLDNIAWLWVFPATALAFAAWILFQLRKRSEASPFFGSIVLFVMAYLGVLISMWPYAVPHTYTFWDASSDPGSQLFLLLGFLFLLPIIIGYTTWNYWIFRGKIRPGAGYAGL